MLSIRDTQIFKDGKPFFYFADTCWSAFTNITDDEWDYYLFKRKKQGFNTIQINILPQWDASYTELEYKPFIDNDPYQLNDGYFEHARKMCVKAKKEGFELALVVLWCNYVPNTWASNLFHSNVLPFDFIDGYVKKVHETFTDLNPMYVISGDTDFLGEDVISYYVETAKKLKNLAKDCLYTTHIKGRYSEIPSDLLNQLDFIFYQSGHNAKDLTMPYSLAEVMKEKYPNKPLINSEPCYEEMGYSGKMYGRWTRKEVRRAAYVSVLSGASAGITYGAAGIYSWHKVKKNFASDLGEAFDTPKCWEEAMNFKGAWDYGYLANIIKELEVYNLKPRQELLVNNTTDIRVASDNGKILVYVPCNTSVKLHGDYSNCKIKAIGLDERFVCELESSYVDDVTRIEMHPFSEDALIIVENTIKL